MESEFFQLLLYNFVPISYCFLIILIFFLLFNILYSFILHAHLTVSSLFSLLFPFHLLLCYVAYIITGAVMSLLWRNKWQSLLPLYWQHQFTPRPGTPRQFQGPSQEDAATCHPHQPAHPLSQVWTGPEPLHLPCPCPAWPPRLVWDLWTRYVGLSWLDLMEVWLGFEFLFNSSSVMINN